MKGIKLCSIRPRETDFVTGVFVPKMEEGDDIFFKKFARRKTADLAVVNLAVFTSKRNPGATAVVVGGVDLAVPTCEGQDGPVQARNIANAIHDGNSFNLKSPKVEEAIRKDLGKCANSFKVKRIQEMLSMCTPNEVSSFVPPKAHQLYEKAAADQRDINPVQRPVPHVSAAEQCTGQAGFVADIPKLDNELQLVPVQSTAAHAKILGIDTGEALRVAGVVAWISADDVPGLNLWSVGGAPDEPVLAHKAVFHHGQIIGVLAAKAIEAGAQAAKLVKITYEELPGIKTLSSAVVEDSCYSKQKLKRLQVKYFIAFKQIHIHEIQILIRLFK